MNRTRLAVSAAVATLALLHADTILAAEPAAAPPPAAAPSDAAKELAALLVPKEKWAQGVEQLASMVQQTLKGHPGSGLQFPSDLPGRAKAEVEAALPYQDLLGIHAQELSRSYTETELKELSGFFRTPVGRKWLEVQPKTADAVTLATQRRFDQKVPAILQKLSAQAKPSPKGKVEAAKKPSAHP